MNTILKLECDIAMRAADANYCERLADDCYMEAGLLRSDLKETQSGDLLSLEDAQHLATIILALDGLTGAEIETAQRVVSGDFNPKRDTQRLRAIAINHSILERWMIR
jgi:hypothetical protein